MIWGTEEEVTPKDVLVLCQRVRTKKEGVLLPSAVAIAEHNTISS